MGKPKQSYFIGVRIHNFKAMVNLMLNLGKVIQISLLKDLYTEISCIQPNHNNATKLQIAEFILKEVHNAVITHTMVIISAKIEYGLKGYRPRKQE